MRNIFLFATFLIGFWIVFIGLQNKTVYHKTLGIVSQNWVNIDGDRKLVDTPFTQLSNAKLLRWDAIHYKFLKDNGYNIQKANGDYIFAFFPLFPFVWKVSFLPAIGIVFLNYLMFSISILILLRLFSSTQDFRTNILLALSLPSLIIFLIPYSEATFFLTLSIGFYGFIKKKYWIFFIGIFLASLTRPAYTFLVLAIICTEIFFFLDHKKLLESVKNIFARILPLIIGTLLVSAIQLLHGSGDLLRFIKVQKYWDNKLAIPHNLRDWSLEGFGINIGIIFLIFAPIVCILMVLIGQKLWKLNDTQKRLIASVGFHQYYLIILSIIYFIGSTVFIILFRGGSLNCLFRFTLCTPFTFILLFGAFNLIKEIPITFRFFIISTLSMLSIFILGVTDYSTYWTFSDFGIFILILTLFLWLFQDFSSNSLYKSLLYLNVIFNIFWTAYLFNTFLNDGWIFA